MSAKRRHQSKVMEDLVRGSDAYYRKHPDIAKASGIDLEKSQQARDQWQIEHYGTVTFERMSKDVAYHRVEAVPVEIEVPWELDQLVKMDILETLGITYSEWVQRCYRERMKQILTDPAEFGKVLLWDIKRGHCLEDDQLED